MKVEIKITDEENEEVYFINFDRDKPISDEELETFSLEYYGQEDEGIWKRIRRAWLQGAMYGRDITYNKLIRREYYD